MVSGASFSCRWLQLSVCPTMEALYWLARQSRIYQTAIYFAYHEYPSDPELALNRLKDKSSLPEFQQIRSLTQTLRVRATPI